MLDADERKGIPMIAAYIAGFAIVTAGVAVLLERLRKLNNKEIRR